MTTTNTYVQTLITLRAELIRKRRTCASESRAAELPEIVAQIEAVDKSLSDEKKLEGIV